MIKVIHRLIAIAFLFSSITAFAQDFVKKEELKEGFEVNKWKIKAGDHPEWADVNLNETGWDTVSKNYTPDWADTINGIIWARAKIIIDTTGGVPALALSANTIRAFDIYVNGKQIGSLGKVGKTKAEQVSGFSIKEKFFPIPGPYTSEISIALRMGKYNGEKFNNSFIHINNNENLVSLNGIRIVSFETAVTELRDESNEFHEPLFFSGVFIVLSIFHLILFFFYRKNLTNLYYSIFTFGIFVIFFTAYKIISGTDFTGLVSYSKIVAVATLTIPIFFLGLLYEIFYKKLKRFFYILLVYVLITAVITFNFDSPAFAGIAVIIFFIATGVETLRVYIVAWKKKKEGSRIFMFGLLFPFILLISSGIIESVLRKNGMKVTADFIDDIQGKLFAYGMLMSASLSMTIYLAYDFSRLNKKLQIQIKEIKGLLDKTISQEYEKKTILENQKNELERQVAQRTDEVVRQKAIVELKNKDILDNLLYAKRIQEAILPDTKLIFEVLKDSFILYLPKDIVSGDFYSFSQKEKNVIISAADCTGHGVTGAFMSMIGSSIINQIINENNITRPDEILNHLNSRLITALRQENQENDYIRDGMDIAICSVNVNELKLQYAGANRPVWIIRENELLELKPDKAAIGGLQLRTDLYFSNRTVELKHSDCIYMFTDGYADQFGGQFGKKMLSRRVKELLTTIHHQPMREQQEILFRNLREWQGSNEQVDDILMIGFKI